MEKPPSGGFFVGVFLPVRYGRWASVALGALAANAAVPNREALPEPFIGSVDNFHQPTWMDSMHVGA
jgi:hypothetical protein